MRHRNLATPPKRHHWKLTPDRKLTLRFDDSAPGSEPASDAIDRVVSVLNALMPMRHTPASADA